MERKIVELYTQSGLLSARRRLFASRIITLLVCAAALGICISFCIGVDAHNAVRRLVCAIAVSAVGGWTAITLRLLLISRFKRTAAHYKAVLEGKRERIEGAFSVSDETIRITGGVSIKRVRVIAANAERELSLFSSMRPLFPADKAAAVYSVYDFISAYEVERS